MVQMTTWGPPPGPAAVIRSGVPSPLTSPIAVRTPPVKLVSYAKNEKPEPSAKLILTIGPPPESVETANNLLGFWDLAAKVELMD